MRIGCTAEDGQPYCPFGPTNHMVNDSLRAVDPAVADALDGERTRQAETLAMLASATYVSQAVLQSQGNLLPNQYPEA